MIENSEGRMCFLKKLKLKSIIIYKVINNINLQISEGREGVKWELGLAFFRGWEMGFCALGLGFMKKK